MLEISHSTDVLYASYIFPLQILCMEEFLLPPVPLYLSFYVAKSRVFPGSLDCHPCQNIHQGAAQFPYSRFPYSSCFYCICLSLEDKVQ